MYSWMNVAERTERVYEAMLSKKSVSSRTEDVLLERFQRYYPTGVVLGKVACLLVVLDYLFLLLLDWLYPRQDIDLAP